MINDVPVLSWVTDIHTAPDQCIGSCSLDEVAATLNCSEKDQEAYM